MKPSQEERIADRAQANRRKEGRSTRGEAQNWDDAEKQVVEADSIAAGQPSKDPTHQPRNR